VTPASNFPIVIPDTSTLESELIPLKEAVSMQIASPEDYQKSGEYLKGIKEFKDKVNETFDPILKAANALATSIRQTRDKLIIPADNFRAVIESARESYENLREQERLRLEQEAKEQSEQQRQRQQEVLEAMGLDDSPVDLEPIHIPALPQLPKTQGIINSGRWMAEVFDLRKLVVAVAEGKAPIECLSPNIPTLSKLAQVSRSTLNIPGVRAVKKKYTMVRK